MQREALQTALTVIQQEPQLLAQCDQSEPAHARSADAMQDDHERYLDKGFNFGMLLIVRATVPGHL